MQIFGKACPGSGQQGYDSAVGVEAHVMDVFAQNEVYRIHIVLGSAVASPVVPEACDKDGIVHIRMLRPDKTPAHCLLDQRLLPFFSLGVKKGVQKQRHKEDHKILLLLLRIFFGKFLELDVYFLLDIFQLFRQLF